MFQHVRDPDQIAPCDVEAGRLAALVSLLGSGEHSTCVGGLGPWQQHSKSGRGLRPRFRGLNPGHFGRTTVAEVARGLEVLKLVESVGSEEGETSEQAPPGRYSICVHLYVYTQL